MKNFGIVLQARMGSTRLPGKILKPIGHKRLLEHILYRLTLLRHPYSLVVATSVSRKDDVVAEFCMKNAVTCFRGSERDVLERYFQCAAKYKFQDIVRLTGDNPFVDIEELDRLIDLHRRTGAEYSHSFDSLPIGSGAEIFTFQALERCFLEGKEPQHREHVNEYILENQHLFNVATLQVPIKKNMPDIRLTVDTEEDFHRVCYIFTNCPQEYVSTEEAIELFLQYSPQV